MVRSCRRSASACTAGETPWAEKTVIAPSGIESSSSSTKIAPAIAQGLDHVLVVDDLLADVDRRAVQLERALDGLHRAVDARAVAARRREEELLRGRHAFECRRPPPRSALPVASRNASRFLGRLPHARTRRAPRRGLSRLAAGAPGRRAGGARRAARGAGDAAARRRRRARAGDRRSRRRRRPGPGRERRPALLRLRHRRRAARRAGRRLAGRGVGPERASRYVASPAAAVVEEVAAGWLLDVLGLPATPASASSPARQMANVTCLAAARNTVLERAGWDVERDGLIGAPPMTRGRRRARRTPRSSRALRLLGLGTGRARSGRRPTSRAAMRPADRAAPLDGPAIVCAQAGNVNTGAFDPLERDRRRVRAGRRLAARRRRLRAVGRGEPARAAPGRGVERADSWATDAHKWLNVPYDCGLAIVARPRRAPRRDGPRAAYLDRRPSDARHYDYTPEASRRARGFADLRRAALARPRGRRRPGRPLLRARAALSRGSLASRRRRDPQRRRAQPGARRRASRSAIARVQADGTCWVGGTVWHGRAAMRISVSGWRDDDRRHRALGRGDPQEPVTFSSTSTLPRVAFEYGQRSCALATSASASS